MRVSMLATVLLSVFVSPTSAQSPLEEVGHYGENIGVVSVDGVWGVINEGTKIRVMDVSDPETIVFHGSVDIARVPTGIHLVNDRAYVAGYTGPFSVVNIANPDNPFIEGSLDWIDWKESVWVRRAADYAYVGVCGGILVIDVRDKSQPVGVSEIDGFASCKRSITGDGGYLYVVSDGPTRRLSIYSLVDPGNPVLIGSAIGDNNAADKWNSVAVFGDTLYIGQSNGTMAYDIADRTQPRLIGRVENENRFFGHVLDVDRGILHVSNWGRMDFYNLADANAPVSAGALLSGPNHSVTDNEAFGGYSLSARSIALTLSTPGGSIATIRETTPYVGWSESLVGNAGYIYLGVGPGIAVLSIANPTEPELLHFVNSGWPTELKIEGNTLYSLSAWGVLEAFDITTPSNPSKVFADHPIQGSIRSLKLATSPTRVAATAASTLFVYTRRANGSLEEASQTPLPAPFNSVALNGTLAYVVSTGGELRVYDVSNAAAPHMLFSQDLFPGSTAPNSPCDIDAVDGRLHVFVGRQGYVLMDLTLPSQPNEIGRFAEFQMEGQDIAIDSNIVYLVTGGWSGRNGIRAFDVSNGASIVPVESTRATAYSLQGTVIGDYLYTAEWRGALRIRQALPSHGIAESISGWLIE